MVMNEIPSDVLEAVREEAARHGDDVPAAVAAALARVKSLPGYRRMVDSLVQGCITDLVYDARHQANVKTRRQARYYGRPHRVNVAESEEVRRVCRSLYAYNIGGRTLGSLALPDLLQLAHAEDQAAAGHTRNADLCRRLAPLMQPGRSVRECVDEDRLAAVWREVFGPEDTDEAVA